MVTAMVQSVAQYLAQSKFMSEGRVVLDGVFDDDGDGMV